MGREVKRVPLTFDWELGKVWEGYLSPDRFNEVKCPDCKGGYSQHAQYLYDLWYGRVPFDPAETGSTRLTSSTPAVLAFAERNLANAPEYYGTSRFALSREAQRLADLWNGMWMHHITQADVDALVEAGRLYDFTHTVVRGKGWEPKNPPVVPTAAEVNEWSLRGGFSGHDGINAMVAVRERCKREGVAINCASCEGHGSTEAYPGQRAEAEAWKASEPPTGDGWQLWETVTEGSPESPVFATADELARWMSDPARGDDWVPQATAAKFIAVGWAPTGMSTAETGPVSGVEFIGHHAGGTA